MLRSIAILLVAGLLGAGCGTQNSAESNARGPGPLRVTATTGMIADAIIRVGGDAVQVETLMGPGVDPHVYKASQGDLSKLGDANIIFYNGLHLEGKMADVLVKMAARVPTAAVTENMPEDALREPPEFQGQYDPHVWFDVSLWRYAVETIRDHLIDLDPEQRQTYETNAQAYLEELDTLHQWVQEQIALIPEENRLLITAHDAFGYFEDAYGIEVMGIQGISTVSEYGLQDLEGLVDIIVERKVKAVFVESSVSPRSIEALMAGVQSKGHDVKMGGTLYSDALGESGTDAATYAGMVRWNVNTIVEALQ